MTHWTYRGRPVKELPDGMSAFTYLVKLPTGKWYIGETARQDWHYYKGSGSELIEHYESIGKTIKTGDPNAKYIIIEFYPTKSDALTAESRLIELTDATNNPKYLNKAKFGSYGPYGTTAWNKGVPMSQEQRDKLSEAHMGKELSEEHKRKIGNTVSERFKDPAERAKCANNAWIGRKHTEETKQKMRKPKSEEHKRKLSESAKKAQANRKRNSLGHFI